MKNPFEKNYFTYLILNAPYGILLDAFDRKIRNNYKMRLLEINNKKITLENTINMYLKENPMLKKEIIIKKISPIGLIEFTIVKKSNLHNLAFVDFTDRVKILTYARFLENLNKEIIKGDELVDTIHQYYMTKFFPYIYWFILLFHLHECFKPYKISFLIIFIYIFIFVPLSIIFFLFLWFIHDGFFAFREVFSNFFDILFNILSKIIKFLFRIIKFIIKFMLILMLILLFLYILDKTFNNSDYSLRFILWCCQILYNEIMPSSTYYVHEFFKYSLYYYIQTIFGFFPEEISSALYPRYAESREEYQGMNRVLEEDVTPISIFWLFLLQCVLDFLSALGRFILENR